MFIPSLSEMGFTPEQVGPSINPVLVSDVVSQGQKFGLELCPYELVPLLLLCDLKIPEGSEVVVATPPVDISKYSGGRTSDPECVIPSFRRFSGRTAMGAVRWSNPVLSSVMDTDVEEGAPLDVRLSMKVEQAMNCLRFMFVVPGCRSFAPEDSDLPIVTEIGREKGEQIFRRVDRAAGRKRTASVTFESAR